MKKEFCDVCKEEIKGGKGAGIIMYIGSGDYDLCKVCAKRLKGWLNDYQITMKP